MTVSELQLNGIMLAVSGPVHAVRCESISQSSEMLLFGSPNALAFVMYGNSGSICKSLTECPDLQKCSATPDFSVFLSMMSLRCSFSLSRGCLPVCPIYWQLFFTFCLHVLCGTG